MDETPGNEGGNKNEEAGKQKEPITLTLEIVKQVVTSLWIWIL